MATPRKAKKKRKTGRPLEGVPMKTLVRRVKEDLQEELKVRFAAADRKPKEE
jgi:hypothetical protein